MTAGTLPDVLRDCAARYAQAPALQMRMGYRTVRLTYRDVLTFAERIAGWLERHGIGAGDRVVLAAPSSPYWVCAFWGVQLRGAVIVPLNTQSTAQMVEDVARHTAARAIFAGRQQRTLVPAGMPTFELDHLPDILEGFESGRAKASPAPESLAEILYTSGTTGAPKGVMLTHANLCASLNAVRDLVPVTSDDRFLSILPLSHVFEQLAGFLLPFMRGACIIYAPTPATIGALLAEQGITKLVAVPEFLKVLMHRIDQGVNAAPRPVAVLRDWAMHCRPRWLRRLLCWPIRRRVGRHLDTIACGGAPLDPELARAWEGLGISVLQGYGLTETCAVATSNRLHANRPGSVGQALPDVELELGADDEILIRGPHVFRGYFDDPERTGDVFNAGGWFRTGDLGQLDGDGFLTIKGRKKYLIKGAGAQNVYPEDIEGALNRVPGVRDSCVLGADTPSGAVEIHAVVLPADARAVSDRALDEIVAAANAGLASYQRINRASWWLEHDFPRSATRKVKRDTVKARLASGHAPVSVDVQQTPLVRLLADLSGQAADRIAPTTRVVQELNLDSLLRIELVTRIEEELGVDIEEAQIGATTTVADLEAMLRSARPERARAVYRPWLISRWACVLRALAQQFVVFPLARTFLRVDVANAGALDSITPPIIVMSNHLSIVDSLAILRALPWRLRYRVSYAAARDVLYEEYRRQAPIAEFLFNSFPFPRQEHENIKEGLDTLGRMLDRDFSVVFYPEGRISADGELQPLRRGAGLVATESGVPIVPVRLSGSQHIVPLDKFWPQRRGRVRVGFGTPLHFRHSDSVDGATARIAAALSEL